MILIIYLSLCFVYYFISWRKRNYIFNSFQIIPLYAKESQSSQFIGIFVALFKLIFQIVFISVLLEYFLFNHYAVVNVLKFLTISSLAYVLFSCIVFQVISIPPFLVILVVSIPIFLSSVLGLEKGIFNWTFIALVFVTVLPQLISFDLKYLLSDKILVQIKDQEEKIKKSIFKLKTSIYLAVPFVYLFFGLFEKFIFSKSFIHIYNILNHQHVSKDAIDYFSEFNFFASLIKLIIFSFLFLIFLIYKDYFLNEIKNKIIFKHAEISFDPGKYFKMVYDDRKWKKSPSYYVVLPNEFIHYNEFKKYEYNGFAIKSNNSQLKPVKYISDDIFKIDGDYYVREFSDTMMKMDGKSKQEGNYIIKKPGYSILGLIAIILVISFANIWYSKTIIPQNFRGHYNHEKVDGKKIVFEKETIILTNSNDFTEMRYSFDDEALLVKDEVGNIVGEINVIDGNIFKVFNLRGEVIMYGKNFDNEVYKLEEKK